ncbi:MAG: GNAT family N-acetyltransferase [Candidatus Heimdallarchaeota archaeon]|nr:GNAT family N-acetyltransferase [Candidatus Heimdallarchaeota archaeon]
MHITNLRHDSDHQYFTLWSNLYNELIDGTADHGEALQQDLSIIDKTCKKHGLETPNLYILAHDEQAMGYGMIQMKITEDHIPRECYAFIFVSMQYRRRGIGSALFAQMRTTLDTSWVDKLFCFTDDAASVTFAETMGGKLTGSAYHYRLHMDKFQPVPLDKDLEIQLFEDPELEVYERIIDLYNLAKQDEPSMMTYSAISAPSLKDMLSRYARSTIVAIAIMDNQVIALTELMMSHNQDHAIYQRFSGTHPDYRGRGICSQLKSQAISYVKQRHPDITRIETTMDHENISMKRVNAKLGFVDSGTEYTYEFYAN